MIERHITIINKLGLHARAASKFVTTASAFGCAIQVGKSQIEENQAGESQIEKTGQQQVDGKSIMSVMMLAASQGTELQLQCDGSDEQQAMEALVKLINDRFGEEE